ncbi:MAG: phosphoglucosamine mutase, partial [Xanthomonadales bacterium]|nr:phosphoglucosamine mutase [Xanthomonadales bacterium]
LEVLADSQRTLGEMAADLHRLPQRTINVRIAGNARTLLQNPNILAGRAEVEAALGQGGRLILRASGTEPLIRVTVEARDLAVVEAHSQRLADLVRVTAETTAA